MPRQKSEPARALSGAAGSFVFDPARAGTMNGNAKRSRIDADELADLRRQLFAHLTTMLEADPNADGSAAWSKCAPGLPPMPPRSALRLLVARRPHRACPLIGAKLVQSDATVAAATLTELGVTSTMAMALKGWVAWARVRVRVRDRAGFGFGFGGAQP